MRVRRAEGRERSGIDGDTFIGKRESLVFGPRMRYGYTGIRTVSC